MGEFTSWMDKHVKEYSKNVHDEMINCGRALDVGVKAGAPVGATGNLRRSINFKSFGTGADTYLIFGAGATYAPFVEEGTSPHYPPISALMRWAKQRGINPYALQKAIGKHGTKKHPFFWKPVEAVLSAWRWHL